MTDFGDADFVADPFAVVDRTGTWHLFFEVFNRDQSPPAVIAHATSRTRGASWTYDRVVLTADWNLAFPFVFAFEGTYYMLPDQWTHETQGPARLYRARSFPHSWIPVDGQVAPEGTSDTVVFRHADRWWAIAGDGTDLSAFHSEQLTGDWVAHEGNPVVSDRPVGARPAGRPVVGTDRVLLFLQDCRGRYGKRVRAFEVTDLTTTTYTDREHPDSPILEPSPTRLGWNSGQMHHVDPVPTADGWRFVVDGNIGFGSTLFGPDHWSIGLYQQV